MMKSEFQGQTVLVTGAASGIGRLMALRFADLGARLALVDVNGEGAEKLALELRSNGVGAWAFTADLADIGRIRALPDEVKARAGAVDVLVNNAGVVFGGRFDHVALDRHLLTHRINSEAMMAMTHVFLPQLLQSRAARIVNIASGAGFIGVPFGVSYAASKWAAVGFSESLRQEFLELGVDHVAVTTVCPGYIDTGMFNGVKVERSR
jgi:all-trans-retinol dehydrogenase (NAD+)